MQSNYKSGKMRKLNILLIICILHLNCNAQNKICGEVEYNFTTNIAYEYTENYILKFNNEYSLCLETNVKQTATKETSEFKKKGKQKNVRVGRKNNTKKYFYNTRDSLYVRDVYLNEVLTYKENEINKSWKFFADTKKLSNIICKKATINFRGRNYTAWYATEIQVPFGPWKLRGLPGLILELYDTDYYFHIIATHIKINNNECNINVNKEELKNAMALKTYIKEKEKLIDEYYARLSSKMPKGSKPIVREKNCESCKNKRIEIFNE